MYNPIKNHQFVHGEYSPPNKHTGSDALIANVKDVETGESKLHIIRDPQMEYWVTKKALRTFKEKKECVPIGEVDGYVTRYSTLNESIGKSLGVYTSHTDRRRFMTSPFVFGADIHPLIRMKIEYRKSCDKAINYFKVGALDIETSVLGDNQILLLSYADFHTGKVYCAINNEWGNIDTEALDARIHKEFLQFKNGLNPKALEIMEQKKFDVEYRLCKDEKELLIWSFYKIHQCKPDFCGIWNIGYDIPYIIDRAKFRGIPPEQLFCHPDVPDEYKFISYREDNSPAHNQHITDKWHNVDCPGYTRWYDPMCLFARIRKVEAKLPFYTLDFVGNRVIGVGKMQFGINDTHHAMQTNDKIGYTVYNMFDVIIPVLMNALTNDIISMTILAGCGLLSQFASQTVQLRSFFYEYCLDNGMVPGTVFGSQVVDSDVYIGNIGGAVLNPQFMRMRGSNCIKEIDVSTNIYKLCCDIDFTSQYPSILIAMNVSKDTKMGTIIHLGNLPYTLSQVEKGKDEKDSKGRVNPKARSNAEHIFNFMSQYVTNTEDNAVDICGSFGLVGYKDMLNIWDKNNN